MNARFQFVYAFNCHLTGAGTDLGKCRQDANKKVARRPRQRLNRSPSTSWYGGAGPRAMDGEPPQLTTRAREGPIIPKQASLGSE